MVQGPGLPLARAHVQDFCRQSRLQGSPRAGPGAVRALRADRGPGHSGGSEDEEAARLCHRHDPGSGVGGGGGSGCPREAIDGPRVGGERGREEGKGAASSSGAAPHGSVRASDVPKVRGTRRREQEPPEGFGIWAGSVTTIGFRPERWWLPGSAFHTCRGRAPKGRSDSTPRSAGSGGVRVRGAPELRVAFGTRRGRGLPGAVAARFGGQGPSQVAAPIRAVSPLQSGLGWRAPASWDAAATGSPLSGRRSFGGLWYDRLGPGHRVPN